MDGIKPVGLIKCAGVQCLDWDVALVLDGVPLCSRHRGLLDERVSTREGGEASDVEAPGGVALRTMPGEHPIGSVVLYVQVGSNLHIGWSTDPAGHLMAMTKRHGRVRLAAAEPGGAPEYRAAGAALAQSALGPDEYAPTPEVRGLLKTVKEAYPQWTDMVNEAAWHRAKRRAWVDVAGPYAASLSEAAPETPRTGKVRRTSTVDGGGYVLAVHRGGARGKGQL